MLTTLLSLVALGQPAQADEASLCGVIESDIEPGHHWVEADITRDRYDATLELLRERFPLWIDNSARRLSDQPDASVFDGELAWIWLNSLNVVTAYTLKLEAEAASQTERGDAVDRFCSFLAETVIYD
jgi:hypothetical protein